MLVAGHILSEYARKIGTREPFWTWQNVAAIALTTDGSISPAWETPWFIWRKHGLVHLTPKCPVHVALRYRMSPRHVHLPALCDLQGFALKP